MLERLLKLRKAAVAASLRRLAARRRSVRLGRLPEGPLDQAHQHRALRREESAPRPSARRQFSASKSEPPKITIGGVPFPSARRAAARTVRFRPAKCPYSRPLAPCRREMAFVEFTAAREADRGSQEIRPDLRLVGQLCDAIQPDVRRVCADIGKPPLSADEARSTNPSPGRQAVPRNRCIEKHPPARLRTAAWCGGRRRPEARPRSESSAERDYQRDYKTKKIVRAKIKGLAIPPKPLFCHYFLVGARGFEPPTT
jgi:hypothetical protein